MKSIIFIAPPAAGKGTQASLVCEKYRIPRISTGDILRNKCTEDSDKGIHIKQQLETGGLVSDELIIELIEERINDNDCQNGYILDGFPRTIAQAEEYENMLSRCNKNLGLVLLLEVSEETAKNRIIGRVNCPKCGRSYNLLIDEAKPKVDNKCDDCHCELVKRNDDNADTFKRRYQTYMEKTKPLIDFYENKGVLYRINSDNDVEHTFQQIEKILGDEND